MRIPIREQGSFNIVRWEETSPILNEPIDFNRAPMHIEEPKESIPRKTPTLEKDINLGVTRIVPVEKAYFNGRKPLNVL